MGEVEERNLLEDIQLFEDYAPQDWEVSSRWEFLVTFTFLAQLSEQRVLYLAAGQLADQHDAVAQDSVLGGNQEAD